MEISQMDSQIEALKPWIHKAANALNDFYNDAQGAFWIDNEDKTSDGTAIHPTATNRSFVALCEYLRFLDEEGLGKEYGRSKIVDILRGVTGKFLKDPDRARESPRNKKNMFTDSHYIMSLAFLAGVAQVIKLSDQIAALLNSSKAIVDELTAKLRKWGGGRVTHNDENHDFVTLHAVRAIDAFSQRTHTDHPATIAFLGKRVYEDVLRLLAFRYGNVTSRFDAPELAFSLAILNRFPTPNAAQLTHAAIEAIGQSQAPNGSWPTGRLVSYRGKGLLHVASYEVALALTYVLFQRLYEKDISSVELIFPLLERNFELVKAEYDVTENAVGWANDHSRRPNLIESWATSIVLTFLIRYHDALLQFRQRLVLQRYELDRAANTPSPTASLLRWPDMVPMFRDKNWIDTSGLDSFSDPTDNAGLIANLRKQILEPVADSFLHKPNKVGMLFYGGTGTRKTSLAHFLAKSLGWPLLILSPPTFLKNGLEGFEERAAEIFNDLFRLRRVVVLLDECEEFFKRRSENSLAGSRTIGAFITSGMLPRLQVLAELKWVIFIVATNTKLEDLDEAVRRHGRFDYVTEMIYPTLQAQLRYLDIKFKDVRVDASTKNLVRQALQEYAGRAKVDSDTSPLTFSVIDKLVKEVQRSKPSFVHDLVELVDQLAKGPTSLIPR